MVSMWRPWRRDSTSAADFEKTLSSLATKISKATSKNDSLKQQSRRARVGLILYGGFAYILVFLILTLVTGWQNWGPYEYTIVAGGPVLIYGVRVGLNAYFNWRTERSQANLDKLYKERDSTIEKLKAATKYNSTQQLLDKYGSPRPSPKQDALERKLDGQQGKRQGDGEQRIFRVPPPTANIPRNQPSMTSPTSPSSPQQPQSAISAPPNHPPSPRSQQLSPTSPTSPDAVFAPNAFSDASPQYAPGDGLRGSHWYDRIMDALLGEDETQARNRIALICQRCRLVNGQALPGVKTLEELGKWRCSACGAWNGVESETSRLVKQLVDRDQNVHDDSAGAVAESPADAVTSDDTSETSLDLGNLRASAAASANVGVPGVTNEVDKRTEQEEMGAAEAADTPAKSTRSRTSAKRK